MGTTSKFSLTGLEIIYTISQFLIKYLINKLHDTGQAFWKGRMGDPRMPDLLRFIHFVFEDARRYLNFERKDRCDG
jgi:hypothetical protein